MNEFKLSNDKILKIVHDDSAESPRDCDNLGIIYYSHRSYKLGDIDISGKRDLLQAHYVEDHIGDKDIHLPVYCYEHGNIAISTKPFSCPFDGYQIGFIAVSNAKCIEEYGQNYNIETVKEVLISEIKLFNQYLNGDVYGFELYEINKCDKCGHGDDEIIDSCYGFYGQDIETNGILDYLDDDIKKEILKQIA